MLSPKRYPAELSQQNLDSYSFSSNLIGLSPLKRESMLSRIVETSQGSINLCKSLQELPYIRSHDRNTLAAAALDVVDSPSWQSNKNHVALPPHRLQLLIMQRLSRHFQITERFTSFASENVPYIQPRCSSLEERIEALSDRQLILIARVNEYCPLSSGIMAAFFAEKLTPSDKNNRADIIAVQSAKLHRNTLLLASEAIETVDAFLLALTSRAMSPFSPKSQQIFNAWREDLIRPIIEAAIFGLAAGISPLERGYEDGASWYVSRVIVPEKSIEAKTFYKGWYELFQNNDLFKPLANFEGLNDADVNPKYRRHIGRPLPVPILVGAHDTVQFFSWYIDSFRFLTDAISETQRVDVRKFTSGCLIKFAEGAQLSLRGRIDSYGQPRIGITVPESLGLVSIRLDLEDRGLSLDFGAITQFEMLARSRNLIKDNKKLITHYDKLHQELSAKSPHDVGDIVESLEKRVKLNQVSERISHFTGNSSVANKDMPFFAAAMSGVGRSLGIRSDDTNGHHSRESLYKCSQATTQISRDFDSFIKQITIGLGR